MKHKHDDCDICIRRERREYIANCSIVSFVIILAVLHWLMPLDTRTNSIVALIFGWVPGFLYGRHTARKLP